jgi:hypothetical protein
VTEDELNTIEARLGGITPGPWESYATHVYAPGENGANSCSFGEPRATTTVGYQDIRVSSPDLEEQYRNVAFVTHAPADVAALVAEVKRLRAALAARDG